MLTGQEIGLLSSLQISVIGMLVVMAELFLLYLFVRGLTLVLRQTKKPADGGGTADKQEETRPDEVITDLELCCVMGAVVEASGLSPGQICFTRIERVR